MRIYHISKNVLNITDEMRSEISRNIPLITQNIQDYYSERSITNRNLYMRFTNPYSGKEQIVDILPHPIPEFYPRITGVVESNCLESDNILIKIKIPSNYMLIKDGSYYRLSDKEINDSLQSVLLHELTHAIDPKITMKHRYFYLTKKGEERKLTSEEVHEKWHISSILTSLQEKEKKGLTEELRVNRWNPDKYKSLLQDTYHKRPVEVDAFQTNMVYEIINRINNEALDIGMVKKWLRGEWMSGVDLLSDRFNINMFDTWEKEKPSLLKLLRQRLYSELSKRGML